MPETKGKKIKLCKRADKENKPMKELTLPKPPQTKGENICTYAGCGFSK